MADPPSLTDSLARFFSWSPEVMRLLRTDAPWSGCVLQGEHQLAWVGRVPLRDANGFASKLTSGAQASYALRPDTLSGLTFLEPVAPTSSPTYAFALGDDALLVANSTAAMQQAGAYVVARYDSSAPVLSTNALTLESKNITAGLEALWRYLETFVPLHGSAVDLSNHQRHGISTPHVGDLSSALERLTVWARDIVALSHDVQEGNVQFVFYDDRAQLDATFLPRSGANPLRQTLDAMTTGSALRLLDVGSTALVSALSWTTQTQRREEVSRLVATLPTETTGKPPKRLRSYTHMVNAWAEGRGDWLLLGLRQEGRHTELWAQSSIEQASELEQGLKQTATELLTSRPFSELVNEPVQMAWKLEHEVAQVVLARRSRSALLPSLSPHPMPSESAVQAKLRDRLERLGNDTTAAMVFFPDSVLAALGLRHTQQRIAQATPWVVAVGKKGSAAWVHASLP